MNHRSLWNAIRLSFKILIVCWIFHDAIQFIAQRTIMAYVYPAQHYFSKEHKKQTVKILTSLESAKKLISKCQIEPVILNKDGLQYCGWTICDPAQQDNGHWVLQAVGNTAAVEYYIPRINEQYAAAGFNTFLINNPGVGGSEGISTPKTMGAVQALGLAYLEQEMKAKKIVLAGHSLGGAAIGQAILQHSFKEDVEYLVIQQMTFGKLTHAAKKMNPAVKSLAKPLIRWTGLEMDTVAASRKLVELNIDEYVINRQDLTGYTHDGVIPGKATLGHHLHRASIWQRKTTNYPDTSLDFAHNSAKFIELTAKIIGNWKNQTP